MTQRGAWRTGGGQVGPPAGMRQAARQPGRLPVSNYRSVPALPVVSVLMARGGGGGGGDKCLGLSLFPSTSVPQ